MEDNYKPLVSVAVVTYNSSKTIIETLDSIYNQTYPNLELIVSDDCSPDNTVEICRKWIETHKNRFARTELLTVKANSGVSANMNRGADACRGEWVKDIAGDDVLLPECVDIYVNYIREHADAVCVFAKMEIFGGDEKTRKYNEEKYSKGEEIFSWSIEDQYDYITLRRNWIPAPTAFYNKPKVVALGIRNDERIPFYEDVPKWINYLRKGVHFDYINKATVRYRISDSSLCMHTPEKFTKSYYKCYIYYRFPNDFKKGNKKNAILRWIRAQKTIHDNSIAWRIICRVYKLLFRVC